MNDVAELKEYAKVHARGQRIRNYPEILDRIRTDDAAEPGSWVGEWTRAAELLERSGREVDAVRYYAMARFPYADGPARQAAGERCVEAFDRWRAEQTSVEQLTVETKEGSFRCWTSGLSTTERKPVLIVMGGIVTVKEQWAPMLVHARRLGMAVLVTEMPSIGENTMRYAPDSWRMISALLDEIADRADVARTYATALSFAGHLALRCAVDDPRIRAVITVGAPVSEFFTDLAWQRRLPGITVDTLAHLTGVGPGQVPGGLGGWALTGEQLATLDIPVSYVASLRDEIIPQGEARLLKERVRRLDLIEYDDVHASPGHVRETQLWTTAALLRSRGIGVPQVALLGLLRRGFAARRRLGGRPG